MSYIADKYLEFYRRYGYLPKYFEPYNTREITDLAPTLSTRSNSGGERMRDLC